MCSHQKHTTKPFLNLNHHHPLTGGALGPGFYLSFLTPYIGDDFVGFTSPPLPAKTALPVNVAAHAARRTAGFEQQRKTPPLSSGVGGLFARPLSHLYSTPSARHGAPSLGSPSGWHPRLTHPLSSGILTNQHSSTTSPILLLRPGLCRRLVTARTPPLLYQGLFQAPPPSLHPGLGDSSPPRPTSLNTAWPAVSEP